MKGEYEPVHKLSNDAMFNDLKQPMTQFWRSRHSLTLSISQTAIVATKCACETVPNLLYGAISSDLEW